MEYVSMHHGVLGQKWGVRRYQNEDGTLTAAGKARYDYKESRKALKQTVRDARTDLNSIGWRASRDNARKIAAINKRVEKADVAALDAKAAYKESRGGEKAAFRTYVKAQKKLGLSGSINDQSNGGRGTRLYDHLAQTRGKEYAERVSRKAGNEALTSMVVAGAAAAGMLIVESMMTS